MLEEQIKIVAEARQVKANLDEQKKELYAQWEEATKPLLEQIASQSEKVTEAENKLRYMTIEEYKTTGNKAPAVGVGIRILTKLEYEPKDALKWAMEHQVALSLDKSSFEKFAKATPLDFVQVREEPQATIATNLG